MPAVASRLPRRIGRYELLCELGRGGMAELHLARLHGAGGFARLVAIKLILPHLATERVFVEQFLNEGRIAAKLSHPNLCHVYELDEVDGQLYMAMEYLEGVGWDQLALGLPEDPTAMLRYAAAVIGQACAGLQHAHDHAIVHRDVSPTNLFVTTDGVCKVLDFGVSKLLTEGKRTRTGVLKGKLPYMSPEQIQGLPIDGRSDVFAAGAMLWEALAGKRLFDRDTDFLIWKAITEEPIPSLERGFAPEIDAVVAKALARKPDERYATIRDFAAAIDALVAPLGGAATAAELAALVRGGCGAQLAMRREQVERASTIEAAPDDEPSATMSLAMRGESVLMRTPRRRVLPAVIFGGVVLAAAVVVWIATRPPAAEPEPSPQLARAPTPAPIDAAPAIAADAAVAVDAAPVVKAPPKPKPTVDKPKAIDKPKPTADEPGLVTIQSTPFAMIYIDGAKIDTTPIFQHKLTPGPHTVRAVRDDGRTKTFAIKIAPGKESIVEQIPW